MAERLRLLQLDESYWTGPGRFLTEEFFSTHRSLKVTEEELVDLAAAMVDAFIKGGGVKAVMPAGRRNEVASTLPLLMFDKNALEFYSHALTDEQERRGVWFDELSRPCPGISEGLFKQIALNGFDFLSPEQLACIAVSALCLLVVRDSICHELQLRLPDWLYKALVLEKFYN